MAQDKGDYPVGYGKPPVHTRFQKGQSGNPSGKPKKVLSEDDILLSELSSKVTVTESGKKRRMSKLEVLLKQQVSLAMKGDPKAVRFVTETYRNVQRGKATSDVEADDAPMIVTLVFEEEERRRREMFGEENPHYSEEPFDGR